MSNDYLLDLFSKQKKFFDSSITKNPHFCKMHLIKLKEVIIAHRFQILEALKKDLNKSENESFICEYLIVMNELKYMIKKIKSFAKKRRVCSSLTTIFSKSYIINQPYGNVLICSPWNYPFQLSLIPLIGAIASGNTAFLLLSDQTPFINEVIKSIVHDTFEHDYVSVITKNEVAYENLFDVKYDFVFFTGSKNVGKIIAEKCASTLTPYILELGGKCPCIVDDSSNLEKATRRIARGKLFNAGQTCVAPDYVLVHENVYEPFIQLLKTKIEKFSRDSIDSSSFPKIINLTHFHRLFSYIKNDNLVFGGKVDEHNLLIHPTIINENPDEEIFGPILPVLKYKDINEAISLIKKHDKPLALYIFSKNKKNIASLISNIDSGGVCVNEVLMQIANHHLPFGGVGLSGVGSYHGKYSYAAFSHPRSELVGSNHLDSSLFYPPWTRFKMHIIKLLFKC